MGMRAVLPPRIDRSLRDLDSRVLGERNGSASPHGLPEPVMSPSLVWPTLTWLAPNYDGRELMQHGRHGGVTMTGHSKPRGGLTIALMVALTLVGAGFAMWGGALLHNATSSPVTELPHTDRLPVWLRVKSLFVCASCPRFSVTRHSE